MISFVDQSTISQATWKRNIVDFQKILVKVLEVSKSLDVEDVLEEFDDPKEGKGPEDKSACERYP